MTNTEADKAAARTELSEILDKFDSSTLAGHPSENLEVVLDYVRVLLDQAPELNEDDVTEAICHNCLRDIVIGAEDTDEWIGELSGSKFCASGELHVPH